MKRRKRFAYGTNATPMALVWRLGYLRTESCNLPLARAPMDCPHGHGRCCGQDSAAGERARRDLEHLQPKRQAQRQHQQPKQTAQAVPHSDNLMSEGTEDHLVSCSPCPPIAVSQSAPP